MYINLNDMKTIHKNDIYLLSKKHLEAISILQAISSFHLRIRLNYDSINGFAGTFKELKIKYENRIDTQKRCIDRLVERYNNVLKTLCIFVLCVLFSQCTPKIYLPCKTVVVKDVTFSPIDNKKTYYCECVSNSNIEIILENIKENRKIIGDTTNIVLVGNNVYFGINTKYLK